MKNVKKTYFIFWVGLLIITMILLFTLPSICLFYDIDSLNALIGKTNILNNINIGGLSPAKLMPLMQSYFGVYVPNDFPNNNLPVKFWASFAFILIMYIENIVVVNNTLNKIKTNNDAFFNIPIIAQSVVILLVTTVASLLCVIENKIYYVLVLVIYIIVFIVSLIVFFSSNALKEHISNVDKETKIKRKFMDDLITDVEIILNNVKNNDSNKKLKKLLEEIKYSDSMTNDGLVNIENEISLVFSKIKDNIGSDNNANIVSDVENMLSLIKERNILCKKFK